MKIRHLEIMQDNSELVPYDRPGVPLHMGTARISEYDGMHAVCHWHEDLEWILMLDGRMNYHINDETVLLHPGDTLFVNARQMHYGSSYFGQDCRFLCVVFHPSLFGENRRILSQYVVPVTENGSFPYLHFHAGEEAAEHTRAHLLDILYFKETSPALYEWKTIQCMYSLWEQLLALCPADDAARFDKEDGDRNAQKEMVSYLYRHYAEKITLEEIARAGHVSRSKCCQIFKRYLSRSPIDYLNQYRLQLSCRLLRDTQESITDIALSCGFHQSGYYTKLFRQTYGVTPKAYRKKSTPSA